MVKVLIDTCVWLDIAKTIQGEEILNVLSEFIENREIDLLVPDIIRNEFARNKERIIAEAGKSMSSHFKKVKDMVSQHSSEHDKEMILSRLNDIDKKIPMMGESAHNSIKLIEQLLISGEQIASTDQIKLRAVQRAIEKKAPFHLSKNSIGDAILIEAYHEYKIQNEAQDFSLIFITHNINDFSRKNSNQKNPHEDLAALFDSSKSRYFINILEALNSINPDLIEELKLEADWNFFEFRSFSEILIAENEMADKVWYNRHKTTEQKVINGDIRLIKRSDFSIGDSQRTIVKEIWEGARKSAKKIEKQYGKRNLSFDDFEWGMLNGKLSALRWVIGNEWDFLDS